MPRPNFLIVMTDHQRADSILPECGAVTPNVGRLMAEGVTFTSAFCPSPHCCPSRATFHTGLYPSRHGVKNNVCNRQALATGLRPGVRCWSEDMRAAGYDMRFSGKWHVSVEESPKDRGWTELLVSGHRPGEHGATWDRHRELARREAAEEGRAREEGTILRPGWGRWRVYGTCPEEEMPTRHDERATALGVEAIEDASRGDSPWCVFVGLVGPHDPYVIPQTYLDLHDPANVELPPSFADELADKPAVYARMRRQLFDQLTERETREAVRHFRAYCSYLDSLLGRLLDALDRGGRAEDTVVVYCSDHGDYCAEHGLFAKGIPCFQGAYRVPMVVRRPGGAPSPGRRVDDFVSLADAGPTLLELAGLAPPEGLTGRSLVPFLGGERPPDWRDDIHTQCDGVELYYTQRSVMTREWKYVMNGFDWDELYDLGADPHEMRNLAREPGYDGVKRDMCRRMWRFAAAEDDSANLGYITTGLAPWGPAEAFRG